jgi:hypothetical protein
MKKWLRGWVSWLVAGVLGVVLAVVLIGVCWRGFTLLKQMGHDVKWWTAPPSLDAFDPLEREKAAEDAGRKFGGNTR